MEKKIQFIQISPDELQGDIVKGVSNKLEEIKTILELRIPLEFLSREETANLLKIDLSTLWAWTKKGWLKVYGMGNRVYYKRNEIEDDVKRINYDAS